MQLTIAVSPQAAAHDISLNAQGQIDVSQVTIPANSNSGGFSVEGHVQALIFYPSVSVVVTATLGASQVSATVIFPT